MAVAVASKLETIPISLVPLTLIDESPTNPRKTFKDLEDLAENVKVRGVLQPVMVRPRGTRFELVFGARRLRAAKIAKLDTIPATVRDLPDHEVIEIQLIENSKREDISPLEEADGYRELIDHHGYAPDELAAKVNKSRRTIYERLQLCKLGKDGREAMAKGRLHLSVAILVARIPAELQAQAVKDMAARDDQDPPLPYRSAVDHVQKNYMRQLKDAPFSVTDAELLPKAGACAACPKRTGNQRELFADVKGADVCTDPKCYRDKEDVLWLRMVRDAEVKGQRVLSPAETKKVFAYGNEDPNYNSGFKALDQQEYVGGKMRKVKALVGKDAPVVLARAPSGKLVELVPAALVKTAVRAEEAKHRSAAPARDPAVKAAEEKFQREQQLREAVAVDVFAAVLRKLEGVHDLGKAAWFILGETVLEDENGYGESEALIESRLGRKASSDWEKDESELHTMLSSMSVEQLVGFVFEVSLRRGGAFHKLVRGEKGPINELASLLGVDEKKIRESTKKAVAAKWKESEAAKKSAAKPPKKQGKGASAA
jgi:ParB/RepB/Spo0J family partition protein